MDDNLFIYLTLLFGLLACPSVGFPTDDEDLVQKLTNHRLDLLENGFQVFANEVLPKMEKVQKKLDFVTQTSKEISNKLHDVSTLDSEVMETVEQQKIDIADLLWAVGDLKKHSLEKGDHDILARMEWTIFDLKYSTTMLMEELCRKDIVCTDWSEWSACSVDCGTGKSERLRECSNQGKFKLYCDPILIETVKCAGDKCIAHALSSMDCPKNYISYQGYCLRFSGRRDTRLMSKIECETDDAHLAEIYSLDKHGLIMSFLEEFASIYISKPDQSDITIRDSEFNALDDNYLVAIDGSQHISANDFFNWEGDVMTFFHWAPGQPRRDTLTGSYNCITTNVRDNHWYVRSCTDRFYYVCEAAFGGIYS